MGCKKFFSAAVLLLFALSGCGDKEGSDDLVPPVPAECTDPNGITFDDGDISFASLQTDDPDSAKGEISVEEVNGNPMLKFTDSGTNFEDGTVQKIIFDAAKLLSPENLPEVRTVEMDVYADALSDKFVSDDGDNLKVPGWIGGGGGANVSGDVWYEFGAWEGGEYNFEMSGPIHIEMKFLLAPSGKIWDGEMKEAVFQVMRWGAQNEGNFYVDNIIFKDGEGNSLPIEKRHTEENNDE